MTENQPNPCKGTPLWEIRYFVFGSGQSFHDLMSHKYRTIAKKHQLGACFTFIVLLCDCLSNDPVLSPGKSADMYVCILDTQ